MPENIYHDVDSSLKKLNWPQYSFDKTKNLETPLTLSIPKCMNSVIDVLPTPMKYNTHSPTSVNKSPDGDDNSQLYIVKTNESVRYNEPANGNNSYSGNSDCLTMLNGNSALNKPVPPIYVPSIKLTDVTCHNNLSLSHSEGKILHPASKPIQQINSKLHEDEDILIGYEIKNLTNPIQWRKVKLIGSGSFSEVFLYTGLDNSLPSYLQQVGVKKLKYPKELLNIASPNSPKARDILSRLENSWTRELKILMTLRHPCILKVYAINDPNFLTMKSPITSHSWNNLPLCYIITSYCSGGDLYELASSNKLPDWLIQRIFAELSHAVAYLHDNLVIHRDLKLDNILIKYRIDEIFLMNKSDIIWKNNLIELGDFGLCKKIEPNELTITHCGSEDYVSPDILMGLKTDGRLNDAWAMGVILFALLENRLPFELTDSKPAKLKQKSITNLIINYEWKWLKLNQIDHPGKQIVDHCLTKSAYRWNTSQILQDPYVNDIISQLKFL